ncbi:MAG: metalloregulator ArsR/SmtB family transcription factor [Pseudomonadota bacterium]
MSIDKIFEALSSTVRRRILAYLGHADLTVGEIAERFEMSQPAISKHLSVLENAGLVWRKREGQFIRYGLKEDALSKTLTGFLGEVCPPSRKLRAESRELSGTRKDSDDGPVEA